MFFTWLVPIHHLLSSFSSSMVVIDVLLIVPPMLSVDDEFCKLRSSSFCLLVVDVFTPSCSRYFETRRMYSAVNKDIVTQTNMMRLFRCNILTVVRCGTFLEVDLLLVDLLLRVLDRFYERLSDMEFHFERSWQAW